MSKELKRIITFGTYDLLHEGHLRILERAKNLGDHLIVGISTDALNSSKGKCSVFPQEQRLAYIKALEYVDEVFYEESLEKKDEYIKKFEADVLVMGDDWKGKFDWVSCAVNYLKRTENVSSTIIKSSIFENNKCKKVIFGDTYVQKHLDCANSIVNALTSKNIAPIITNKNKIPKGIDCDCIAYFNKPVNDPPAEYSTKKRVLIDHGASHLKWFLGSKARFDFFDVILTAGPDHVRALESIFPGKSVSKKVRASGFVKAQELLSAPKFTRDEICSRYGLDSKKPITFFAPTWHITANADIITAIESIKSIDNHVASLHPETVNISTNGLNVVQNENGITTELLKHADCVISDVSSTIYEAAALGKPVVQILLMEYPDNISILYDLPYTAGTCELFCGGITSLPKNVATVVQQYYDGAFSEYDPNPSMHKRILAGTFISESSTSNIADELFRICIENEEEKSSPTRGVSLEQEADLVPRYIQNRFYARNRIIGHAGGNFDGHHASNSQEAVKASLNVINIVELDFSIGKDGVLVCHDGFEDKYGIDTSFDEVSSADFCQHRFLGQLAPLKFEDAIDIATKPGKAIVCDIKPTGEGYATIAQAIYDRVEKKKAVERTVIQCYSVDDFKTALQIGFTRCLLPVWKCFYRNPIGEEVFDFIEECISINADAVVGISLPYYNHHLEKPIIEYAEFSRFYSFWKRIFIHGAPTHKYGDIMRKNLGLFADSFSSDIEFKDLTKDFDWQEYIFLNKALVENGIDNQISATVHFIKYGRDEGRLFRYDVPKEFNFGTYLALNPKLGRNGVNTVNSAKAHWTMHGHGEGLKYN